MLILTRRKIAGLLRFEDYIRVVEQAFRAHAEGLAMEPALMHVDALEGEFHVKAGGLLSPEPHFALKMNGGFFGNRERFGLPNIQGMVVLANAANGQPLAVMDSMEITIQRTGAATAIAARHLARPESAVCTICGCGNQGRIQLRAMTHTLPIRKACAYSRSLEKAALFAAVMSEELAIDVLPVTDLAGALSVSDVCVTCTPARQFFVRREDVRPGTFVAAVGSDSPEKQELDPALVAASSVFGDLREQCATVGEFHHALRTGLARKTDFRGELGALVTGLVAGRTSPDEITIFDSTGTALQDVAAAVAVYEKARTLKVGTEIDLTR